MGLFDLFKKKAAEAPEQGVEEEARLPCAVVIVREGLSQPTDDEMLAILTAHTPELAALPRRSLAQPRWWRQSDWLASGMKGVAAAFSAELGVIPDEAEWTLGVDGRGGKFAIVKLFRN